MSDVQSLASRTVSALLRRSSRMFASGAAGRLHYHYGDGKGGYAIWVGTATDAKLARETGRLPHRPRPLRVVCEEQSLRGSFEPPKFEVLTLAEFAQRKIPILVLPTPGKSESELEQKLRGFVRGSGHNFSPYDAYSDSKVAEKRDLRRYRDVELVVLPSVLWPTLYSNWEYMNFLVDELKANSNISVLDMFTGSGVIGFCLKQEAAVRSVSFCDVNYWSVRSIRATSARTPALRPEAIYLSEGLTGVPASARFDLIVGNPPHADLPLEGPHLLAGADPNWEAHHLFFRDAYKHLNPGGRIIFNESEASGIEVGFYSKLEACYPQYRLGRSIELVNNICYIREICLRD